MKIEGMVRLDRNLATLEKRVVNKVVRQALRKGLQPIKAEIQSNAPTETGALKASLKVRAGRRSRKEIRMACFVDVRTKDGTSHPYSAHVEYGTSRMPGKGFMRKAFDSRGQYAKSTIIDELAGGIAREAMAGR